VLAQRRWGDCVFGLAGNPVLLRQAGPVMQTVVATAYSVSPPASSRG
jgi:hypothetical protein